MRTMILVLISYVVIMLVSITIRHMARPLYRESEILRREARKRLRAEEAERLKRQAAKRAKESADTRH